MTVTKKQVALAVLLAVFLFSGGMMIRQQVLYQELDAERLEAAQIAGLAPGDAALQTPPSQNSAPPEEPDSLPEDAAFLAAIDLKALQDVNKDVTGWITIPDTELSYPVVQGEDNQYYLAHNWKREPSSGGAVFLESTNDREMDNFHTIIYAHQMRNNSMFGILAYYKDLDFWREHPSIYLVAGNDICRYDIFSAQKASTKAIVYRLDIEESRLEEEFLQYCVSNSTIDTGVVPKAGERILTLSTCAGSDRANRWVVHAVLQAVWTVG